MIKTFILSSLILVIISAQCGFDNAHVDALSGNCVCDSGYFALYNKLDQIAECSSTNPAVARTKCHASCNCDYVESACPELSCNQCRTCKEPAMAELVNHDYCVCSDGFKLVDGSEWQCEPIDLKPIKDATCDWQLYNTIVNMVVHSNCSFFKDPSSNISYVKDRLTYDWARVATVALEDRCKNAMGVSLLISKSCLDSDYLPFSASYYTTTTDGTADNNKQTNITIPLIDVYDLTAAPVIQNRNINQTICLELDLSNSQNQVVRKHRFQIRVYTNRDQVQTFHLDVTPQITEGCDLGQECIVVANLDVEGKICKTSSCTTYEAPGTVPSYIVGSNMYVRISFVDSTYDQYLSPQRVTFVDNTGIYIYEKGVQWFIHNQDKGFVDIRIVLFQPQVGATVQVTLKIALGPGLLRALQDKSNVGEEVSRNFKVEITDPKDTNQTTSDNSETSSFESLLFLSFLSLVSFLLI